MTKDGRFDYNDLKDMADFAAMENDSLEFRRELVKEAFEVNGFEWRGLSDKILNWFAGADHDESHLPAGPELIPAICAIDFDVHEVRPLRHE